MRLTDPMTRLLAGRTWRYLLGLLVLVEAIFVAESFTTLMRQVVSNGGSVLDLARLVALKMPEVLDFALPIAVMISVYFAVTGAREDNELVVCAAAGVPWARVPRFAALVGLAMLCVSLLFAGLLAPLSAHALRLSIYELRAERIVSTITEPDQRTATQTLSGRTFISAPRSGDPEAARGYLFVFQPDEGDGWRVSVADDWTVTGPDERGAHSVALQGFREYSGAPAQEVLEPDALTLPGPRANLPPATLRVGNMTMAFRIDALIEAVDRTRHGAERLMGDLMTEFRSGVPADGARRLGEMIARALLCPAAALMAVAAAAFAATRQGQYVALPGAAVLVMTGDILSRAALGDAALGGAWALAGAAAGALAVGAGLPLAYILRRREAVIAPARRNA